MEFIIPPTSKIKITVEIVCPVCGFNGVRASGCDTCRITYMHHWRKANREYRNTYLRLYRAHKRKQQAAINALVDAQALAINALTEVTTAQATVIQVSRHPYVTMPDGMKKFDS